MIVISGDRGLAGAYNVNVIRLATEFTLEQDAPMRLISVGKKGSDLLVRSGAFGLVVLDLGANARVQAAVQARLAGLARKHHSAVLYLTEKDRERSSVGALISIRAEAARAWGKRRDRDRFSCEVRILKDKRHGPGWSHEEICHGPDGLH